MNDNHKYMENLIPVSKQIEPHHEKSMFLVLMVRSKGYKTIIIEF